MSSQAIFVPMGDFFGAVTLECLNTGQKGKKKRVRKVSSAGHSEGNQAVDMRA